MANHNNRNRRNNVSILGTTFVSGLRLIVASQAFVPIVGEGIRGQRLSPIPSIIDRPGGNFAVISNIDERGDFVGVWLVSLEINDHDEPKGLVFPKSSSRPLFNNEVRHLQNGGGEVITKFKARKGIGGVAKTLEIIELLERGA